MGERRVLIPIADTVTARETVDFAVRGVDVAEVHLVVALSTEVDTPEGDVERSEADTLLTRAEAWAREDVEDADVAIYTAILGRDRYLFGPTDFADEIGSYANEHDVDRIVIDPEYWVDSVGPMLASFERALRSDGIEVIEAHPVRPARHEQLTARSTPAKIGTLFVISYAFYLLLGDPTYWFDVLTGAVVGGLVAITLGSVTFGRTPEFPGSVLRTVRFALYVPYLVFEIVKANIVISAVILHPRLPIEPRMTRVNAKVASGLPLLALANSITLTPGTLTVRANDQRLLVHTLVPASREDLFDGRLERAVRFVFYGRRFARIATPRERGDATVLTGDDSQ